MLGLPVADLTNIRDVLSEAPEITIFLAVTATLIKHSVQFQGDKPQRARLHRSQQ